MIIIISDNHNNNDNNSNNNTNNHHHHASRHHPLSHYLTLFCMKSCDFDAIEALLENVGQSTWKELTITLHNLYFVTSFRGFSLKKHYWTMSPFGVRLRILFGYVKTGSCKLNSRTSTTVATCWAALINTWRKLQALVLSNNVTSNNETNDYNDKHDNNDHSGNNENDNNDTNN